MDNAFSSNILVSQSNITKIILKQLLLIDHNYEYNMSRFLNAIENITPTSTEHYQYESIKVEDFENVIQNNQVILEKTIFFTCFYFLWGSDFETSKIIEYGVYYVDFSVHA